MITYEQAKKIALASLAEIAGGRELVIQDEQTIVKRYGWVLFYVTRRFAETGSFLYMVGGGGPVVVRHNRRVHFLHGRTAAEPTIAEFEKKHWLKP